MQDFGEASRLALMLMLSLDADLLEIIVLSLRVSLSALIVSCILGLPLGAVLAVTRFPGRGGVLLLVNALMGLPPVVVGLVVYLHLSNAGPFGWLQLLYTPTAMIIAQTILITPIVTALSRQVLEDLYEEYKDQFCSLSVPLSTAIGALIWDARYSLLTVALAGFGRAIAEVGAVIIVGGNIAHLTRDHSDRTRNIEGRFAARLGAWHDFVGYCARRECAGHGHQDDSGASRLCLIDRHRPKTTARMTWHLPRQKTRSYRLKRKNCASTSMARG